jgi:hypothetical protein
VKIVADESIDKQIVERLREGGHSVLFIAELDPAARRKVRHELVRLR